MHFLKQDVVYGMFFSTDNYFHPISVLITTKAVC